MSIPTKLVGATNTITVDGVDLHTMGMIVLDVKNPPPAARDSSSQIPQRDGDFDFTTHYGPRYMTLSGSIIGNTNADCLANIDALKSFFRLRKDRGTFQVIFQNQTDRYWTCRLQSFDVGSYGKWFSGHSAAFSLSMKCVKPYAEALAVTTVNAFMHCNKNQVISYSGTVDAPMTLRITQRKYENLLEYTHPDCNEDYAAGWSFSNATGSNAIAAQSLFGEACPKATRSGAGTFYAELDAGTHLLSSRYYVFGAYMRIDQAFTDHLYAIINGGTNVSAQFSPVAGVMDWYFAFLKISPAQLSGMSSVKFRLDNSGSASSFCIDGAFIYEITAVEYNDSYYFPPPYQNVAAPNWFLPPKNPSLILHKNLNLFQWKNGDLSAWESVGESILPDIVCDPIEPGEKCLMVNAQESNDMCISGIIYVTPGEIYQMTFDYFIEKLDGTFFIGFGGFSNEGKPQFYHELAKIVSPEAGIAWVHNYTSEPYRFLIPAECGSLRFIVHQAGAGSLKLYLKNLQIAKPVLITDPVIPYVNPDIAQLSYTGTIANDDTLLIDNDSFTSEYYANATKLVSNGMAAISGVPLLLCPGANTLRYLDARYGAEWPESESSGSVNCSISYRARYL